MSTVQEIYEDLAHWIGDDVDILSLFNLAQNLIAKRLYWLGSDLIIGELEVGIFDSVTETASDIAFVDNGGTADTITQTAAGLITAGFKVGMPITTTSTVNPGPFHLVTVAAAVLTLRDEDSVTSESAGSSVTITSDDAFGYLPDDFWGLKIDNESWPYLDGQFWPLQPLPSSQIAQQYTAAGLPRWYKIKGNRIYVTPPTSADYTIKCDYFQKPTKFTDVSDTLPWNELFDDLIHELVINLFKKGTLLEQDTMNLLHNAVDLIAVKREGRAPSQAPRGIVYADYI